MADLRSNVIKYLNEEYNDVVQFWLDGCSMQRSRSIQDHCDFLYAVYLIGEQDHLKESSIDSFLDYISTIELIGWSQKRATGPRIGIHNTAYLFGALNLLPIDKGAAYERVLRDKTFSPSALFDSQYVPIYPRRWSHHSWRVSHWLGGAPSILMSVERSASNYSNVTAGLASKVREATTPLINPHNGLIVAYKSKILQKTFRALYTLRHNALLADIGGIAHILWIDHAMSRRYTAVNEIYEQSSRLFSANRPFMEKVPYCLDFDVVQALRTSAEQLGGGTEQDRKRALEMMTSIEAYFESPMSPYTLHKLPGALATYHECGLLLGMDRLPGVNSTPIDIIKVAHWL